MEEAKHQELAHGTAFGAVNYHFAYNNPAYSNFALRIASFASLDGDQDGQQPPYIVLDPPQEAEEEEHGNEGSIRRADRINVTAHDSSSTADESEMGVKATDGNEMDGNTRQNQCGIQQIRTLHVNPTLLSAHSSFFLQFFSGALGQPRQRKATLYVRALEEPAIMDLLQYMYRGRIQANNETEVMNVLHAAEKFGALYCIQYCLRLLESIPATLEWALTWMQMPITLVNHAAAKKLTKTAKSIIIDHFKNLRLEATLALPVEVVKVLLASDQVVVDSEDDVFDFVTAWAEKKYPEIMERNQALADSLFPLVRFPMMTAKKLQRLLDEKMGLGTGAFTLEAIAEAFAFKLGPPHSWTERVAREGGAEKRSYIKRSYKRLPVVSCVQFGQQKFGIVYINISEQDCAPLAHGEAVESERFDLQWGVFDVVYKKDPSEDALTIDLCLEDSEALPCWVCCRFSARSSSLRGSYKLFHSVTNMYTKLETGLAVPFTGAWSDFRAPRNPFFVDGTQWLQVEIHSTSSPKPKS